MSMSGMKKTMNQSKVHSSQGNVPFAWENKPGVCKVRRDGDRDGDDDDEERPAAAAEHSVITKIRPPPCPLDEGRPSVHQSPIPLPPCVFQGPPSRCSSKKLGKKEEHDPFLAAYKECTKSIRKGHDGGKARVGRSSLFSLSSCKLSCDVWDDNLVTKSLKVSRGRGRDDGRKFVSP